MQPDLGDVVFPFQTHGNKIIGAIECVSGQTEADGIYTDDAKHFMGISTADCLPLVLLTETKALALHVSRKTLVRGLVENIPAIINLQEITHAYIGPHICQQHFIFEYAGEEIQEFMKKFPDSFTEKDGVIHISLINTVQQYCDQWELKNIPIHTDNRCTFEDRTLASKRRTGKANPGIFTVVRKVKK